MRTLLHRCACGGKSSSDGECEACRKRRLRRQAGRRAGGPTTAPPVVHSVLNSPGRPLDTPVRSAMESRFGHDFGHVRIHDDGTAAASAAAVDADAYAVGSHVVFGAGRYAPGSTAGRYLLAHELAHVVQQQDVSSNGPIEIVPRDHASEREAETAAGRAMSGAGFRLGRASGLQRYSHQDCTEDDLKNHIWPADGLARKMVARSLAAVKPSPVSAKTQALFAKYFTTKTPDTAEIEKQFRTLKWAFDFNDYTYECEEDCPSSWNAYSGPLMDIHLCMNKLRGRSNDCIARTIIHEFTHKFCWLDDEAKCYKGCDTAGCPSDLDADDALDNTYSFAGFAFEV